MYLRCARPLKQLYHHGVVGASSHGSKNDYIKALILSSVI